MSEVSPSTLQPGLKIGDKLDQFEVVEQIGAGGSSIVWKGYDALLDRHVAIKQLFAAQDELFRQRFREEAKVQRMLGEKHPYVVRLIDVIEDERGMFLVTEFVDGPDLEQLLARSAEPMDVGKATKIMWAIALALQDLHEAGVVHRDLKPSNILLPKQGSGVRLCDLGLASLIAEQEALSLGSVRYMAPELFQGDAVDGRCDLYALGMIAYEMLVGRKAFASAFRTILRDERNQSMRWMKWHTNLRLTPPPPSQLNEAVPEKLSELVMRLLEKDRTKRVSSAGQLIEAMQLHFGHRAAEPAPQPTTGTAKQYAPAGDTAALPTRKKWPLVVAAVVLFGAIGVFGFLLIRDMQQEAAYEQQRQTARQTFQQAEQADTDGNFEQAATLFREAAEQWPDQVEDQSFVDRAEGWAMLAEVRRAIERGALGAAETQLLELQKARYDNIGLATITELRKEIDLRRHFIAEADQVRQMIDAGDLTDARARLMQLGDMALTEQERDQLADMRTVVEDQIRKRRFENLLAQVDALAADGKIEEAKERLLELQRRFNDPRAAAKLDALTMDQRRQQMLTEAEEAEKRGDIATAINVLTRLLSMSDDPQIRTKLNSMKLEAAIAEGIRLYESGNEAAARSMFIESKRYGESEEADEYLAQMAQADRRQALIADGDAAAGAYKWAEAVKQYEKAYEIAEDRALEQKLNEARLRDYLQRGDRLLQAEKFEQARDVFEQAAEVAPQSKDASSGIAEAQKRLEYVTLIQDAEAYRQASKYGKAIDAVRQALEVMQTVEARQRLESYEFEWYIAQARGFIAVGNFKAAEAALDTARKIQNNPLLREVEKELAEAKEG